MFRIYANHLILVFLIYLSLSLSVTQTAFKQAVWYLDNTKGRKNKEEESRDVLSFGEEFDRIYLDFRCKYMMDSINYMLINLNALQLHDYVN